MTHERELNEKLLLKMANVIAEAKHVPHEEALRRASGAQRAMQQQVKKRKNQIRARLIELQIAALESIGPDFKKPEYQHLFERIADSVLRAFESYAGSSDTDRIKAMYLSREKEIISNFLASVPRSTGKVNAVTNDLLDGQLEGVLNLEGFQLSAEDRTNLINAFRDIFRVYAGMRRSGFDDEAEIKYEEAEQQILNAVQGLLKRARNAEADNRLKDKMTEVLNIAELNLSEYQLRSITDQILWLFRTYLEVPDEKKELAYQLGEDRIVFSIFDPHYLRGSLKAGKG